MLITTLQQPEGISVEGTLFDLADYEKPSKPIHDYDLDNHGIDDDNSLEAYNQQCRKSSNILNAAAASADSVTPSTNGTQTESVLPTTATSTPTRSPSTPPISPACESIATSAPISPGVENSTSLRAGSPAPEPVLPGAEPDSTISNHPCGEKDCESSAKFDPAILSGSNLWELSNKDYANWLEPAEWQDILAESSESLLPSLGLATRENASSLSVPTLMTGTGSIRNAGQTKCEQKLKELGIVPPGFQLSPEGMAALMGFPLDWFAAIAPVRYPLLSTVWRMDSPSAMMFGGSPVDVSLPPKQPLPLPSPSGIGNDSVRIGASTLSESLDSPSPRDFKVTTAWGEFYGSENGRIWESKSHRQRWNWKNMEVLELEQLGTERLIIPYGRLPIAPDGSRPVVPALGSVKFARPFWVEEEELFAIEVEMTSKLNDTVLAIDSEPERSPARSLGSQGREKLREFAETLSEEGLRALVRRLSESLGDDSVEEVDRVLDESSFEEKTENSSPELKKSVSKDSITRMAVTDTCSRNFTACSDEPTNLESAEPSCSPDEPPGRGAEPVLSPSSVGVYAPGGEARGGHEYFRLTWWENGRSRHKHIRGGNTSKPGALSRMRQIIDAIAARWSFPDVLALC